MEDVIFAPGSVPVAVAARIYGKDATWVRAGLITGYLQIGTATTTNVSQTKSTNDYKWVNDLYDNLFKIVFGEDYDINEVTYNYKTQTYHYEDETVTEEQLEWLVYYCVYSK